MILNKNDTKILSSEREIGDNEDLIPPVNIQVASGRSKKSYSRMKGMEDPERYINEVKEMVEVFNGNRKPSVHSRIQNILK